MMHFGCCCKTYNYLQEDGSFRVTVCISLLNITVANLTFKCFILAFDLAVYIYVLRSCSLQKLLVMRLTWPRLYVLSQRLKRGKESYLTGVRKWPMES